MSAAFKFDLYGMPADNALDAWVDLRGTVEFADMGARLGVNQRTLEKWYQVAANAGDRRAVGRGDDSVGVIRQGVMRLPGSGGRRVS